MFRSVARKLFKVFNEVGLVEEIIFVTKFCERFCFIQIVKNGVKPNNGSKFFGCCPDHFSKPFFKWTLANKKPFV